MKQSTVKCEEVPLSNINVLYGVRCEEYIDNPECQKPKSSEPNSGVCEPYVFPHAAGN